MKFIFIGWCHDPEHNHDKVWGIIQLTEKNRHYYGSSGDFVTFWGRRGRPLKTKIYKDHTEWDMRDLANKKLREYKEIDNNQLHTVYPEFQQDLEKTAFWATFKI